MQKSFFDDVCTITKDMTNIATTNMIQKRKLTPVKSELSIAVPAKITAS